MDRPVVALAVGAPAGLDEAVVEREVMANGIAPAGPAGPEVGIVLEDVLIDVGEHELLLGRGEYRHGDQADVAVLGFRFLGYPLVMRVQQRHGQGEPTGVTGRGRGCRVQRQRCRESRAHAQMGRRRPRWRMRDAGVLRVQLLRQSQTFRHRVVVQLQPVVLEARQEAGHWITQADGQRLLGRWWTLVAAHDDQQLSLLLLASTWQHRPSRTGRLHVGRVNGDSPPRS